MKYGCGIDEVPEFAEDKFIVKVYKFKGSSKVLEVGSSSALGSEVMDWQYLSSLNVVFQFVEQ